MVKIKVIVPSLHKEYDISLNEKALISDIISDMLDLIEYQTGLYVVDRDKFVLCKQRSESICSPMNRLIDYQVVNGDSLVLV